MAGGSPPAEVDISENLDVLLTARSVTTVASEKWMERFVINLDVLCSDGLVSGDDPARGSSDVGSDVFVVSDTRQTAVSVRTVVTEKWMDRFVKRPGGVSVCFQDECGGRPCLRSIPLLFFILWGGGG